MSLHPLTNVEIQKYYQNEHKFNGVYSRNNLLKIKDGVYVINLDDYKSIQSHWIVLYVNDNNVIYFDSFGVEKFKKLQEKKYYKKCSYNKSIQFDNAWILFHWIYWFYVKRQIYFLLMIMRRMIK